MSQDNRQRLAPLDWMRGLVMMLMTVDHVSSIFNRDKVFQDSYALGAAGASLFNEPGNPLDFLTRWITHLCAPTFVFLAGTALALSVAKRMERGDSCWAIDGHLLARGSILIMLEVWMSLGGMFPVLQVLYAIGASLMFMTLLRRLPSWALVGLALLWMGGGEWFTEVIGLKPDSPGQGPPFAPVWGALLFVNGLIPLPFTLPAVGWMPETGVAFSLYPFIPWLAIMMLGWCFGRWLVARRGAEDLARSAARLLTTGAVLGLGAFVVQRLLDGYGNFWLPLGDDTALRWLQVSKYPPSLAFYGLELGIMALLLAGFFRFQRAKVRTNGPLLVFGQVALFYYLIHIHALMIVRWLWIGFDSKGPLRTPGTWLATGAALLVLYPACRAYRSLKRAHPSGVLRFF